ncbi:MAG: hypothetical protein U0X75_19290 [Acidobacteriota bacterium]
MFTDKTGACSLGNAATSAEADKFKLLSRPGFDPAQFFLSVGSGQPHLEEWPVPTREPFDHQPPEFLGRNADMQELIALLNRHRAAVIIGVSGVGKTELAKQLLAGLWLGSRGQTRNTWLLFGWSTPNPPKKRESRLRSHWDCRRMELPTMEPCKERYLVIGC